MSRGKRQLRLFDTTTVEAFEMKDLEYSLREGLQSALLLAKRGNVMPLGRLIATSAYAIRLDGMITNVDTEDLRRQLKVLKDKYEPEE